MHYSRLHKFSKPVAPKRTCKFCGQTFQSLVQMNNHFGRRAHGRPARPVTEILCDVCGESFKSTSAHRLHQEKRHPMARHSCQLCSKKFGKKGDLKSHQKVHGKAFACKECGKKYTSQDALDLHLEWKHKRGSNSSGFPCQVCGKKFHNKYEIEPHLKVHHGPFGMTKTVPCQLCHRKFRSEQEVEAHAKKCHDPSRKRSFPCDLCDVVSFTKHQLAAHKRNVHEKRKDFQCRYCIRKFPSLNGREVHERSHTGEQPYKCDFKGCNMAYTDRSNLRTHQWSHKGLKPYNCDKCSVGFMRKKSLTAHRIRCPSVVSSEVAKEDACEVAKGSAASKNL